MARPVGSKNKPQFHTYVTEIERKEFVKWVKANFKKDKDLAKWYGDQMFGKATQGVEMSGSLEHSLDPETMEAINKALGDV